MMRMEIWKTHTKEMAGMNEKVYNYIDEIDWPEWIEELFDNDEPNNTIIEEYNWQFIEDVNNDIHTIDIDDA